MEENCDAYVYKYDGFGEDRDAPIRLGRGEEHSAVAFTTNSRSKVNGGGTQVKCDGTAATGAKVRFIRSGQSENHVVLRVLSSSSNTGVGLLLNAFNLDKGNIGISNQYVEVFNFDRLKQDFIQTDEIEIWEKLFGRNALDGAYVILRGNNTYQIDIPLGDMERIISPLMIFDSKKMIIVGRIRYDR